MRDDVVACGGGFPDAAIPSPKELDRGIDVIAANGARAPDSHDRCLLLRRMIREPRRAILATATASHYPTELRRAVQNGTLWSVGWIRGHVRADEWRVT